MPLTNPTSDDMLHVENIFLVDLEECLVYTWGGSVPKARSLSSVVLRYKNEIWFPFHKTNLVYVYRNYYRKLQNYTIACCTLKAAVYTPI